MFIKKCWFHKIWLLLSHLLCLHWQTFVWIWKNIFVVAWLENLRLWNTYWRFLSLVNLYIISLNFNSANSAFYAKFIAFNNFKPKKTNSTNKTAQNIDCWLNWLQMPLKILIYQNSLITLLQYSLSAFVLLSQTNLNYLIPFQGLWLDRKIVETEKSYICILSNNLWHDYIKHWRVSLLTFSEDLKMKWKKSSRKNFHS